MCWVVLTVALVVLALGREGLRDVGAPQSGQESEVAQFTAGCPNEQDREATRTRGTCTSSGPCWSLPRTVVVAFLTMPAERHCPPHSTDGLVGWILPPPYQPPRISI